MAKNKFKVLAEITSRMNKDLILVGGGAVEFYTGGWYTTGDLDLITTNSRRLKIVLKEMGFARSSDRGFIKEDIYIDLVGSSLSGRRHVDLDLGDPSEVIRVIAIEDIIIDRLCACKHWDSPKDCEQALYMISAFREDLDMKYLEKRADKEEVVDRLRSMQAWLDEKKSQG